MAVFVYYGEFARFSDCENWIASALDRNGHYCVRLQRIESAPDIGRIIRTIHNHSATYLLLTKTPELTPDDLQKIRDRTSVRIVFWTFDWMMDPPNWNWYFPLAQMADICFQTDGYGEQAYWDNGINRVELHQGLEPSVHRTHTGISTKQVETFAADISFCGSVYTRRRQALCVELSRYDFKKWGGPDDVAVWGRDFAAMCRCSKIVIGDNYVNNVPGYWSDRVYLTLACGGFFMTAYVDGLEREFENHKHLVWWNGFEEMHALIEHFLPLEAHRRNISLEGQALVQGRDTYDHRIAKMMERLRAL